ncbi:nuclear transport factor 2 family protein [Streptomyces sp. NPDC001705]
MGSQVIQHDAPTPRSSSATIPADVTAVAQLVLHERHAGDRGWWNDMRRSFADDSDVRLSWFQGTGPDFVSASERMAERGDVSVHRLAPPVVDVNGDRALAVVPAGIEVRPDLDGVEVLRPPPVPGGTPARRLAARRPEPRLRTRHAQRLPARARP